MPEVAVGHLCGLNLDSRLQTAGMTDFESNFRVNDDFFGKENFMDRHHLYIFVSAVWFVNGSILIANQVHAIITGRQ